jgi:hypothetical protein
MWLHLVLYKTNWKRDLNDITFFFFDVINTNPMWLIFFYNIHRLRLLWKLDNTRNFLFWTGDFLNRLCSCFKRLVTDNFLNRLCSCFKRLVTDEFLNRLCSCFKRLVTDNFLNRLCSCFKRLVTDHFLNRLCSCFKRLVTDDFLYFFVGSLIR